MQWHKKSVEAHMDVKLTFFTRTNDNLVYSLSIIFLILF